jgi:hypothetical protein
MSAECSVTCSGCWQDKHQGHDVGQRHEAGRLQSATCHDCGETYSRPVRRPYDPGVETEQ